MNKEKLILNIHQVFKEHDILWLIRDWFPENEYQMEESKLSIYILSTPDITLKHIEKKLIEIINEWVWWNMINKHIEYYGPIIKKMSLKIYKLINEN
jgi:hypothetical protein